MNGLDPEEAQRMRNLILAHAATSAVVVSSHNLGDLERFCTHVAFARDGRVLKTARVADLTADGTSLEAAYLRQCGGENKSQQGDKRNTDIRMI